MQTPEIQKKKNQTILENAIFKFLTYPCGVSE